MLRSYRPIPKESAKGKEKRLEFQRAERRVLKRDGYQCQVKAEGCTGRAVTAHHVVARGQGGSNDDPNFLSCCRFCHLLAVHGNPAWAKACGFIKRRELK